MISIKLDLGTIACMVLVSCIILIFIYLFDKKSKDKNYKPKTGHYVLLLVLSFLLILSGCITFIPANTVGIRYSAISGTSNNTLSEGIAFKTPIDKIYMIPTTVQERTVDGVSVQTKDAQFVTMSVNVKYRVDQTNAFKVFKNHTTIENLNSNIIANYAQKYIEKVVTQYNVIEVLGEQKNTVYEQAEKELKKQFEKEGIELVELIIKDMDAGEAIETAIQKEAVAKKEVETAIQQQEKAKIEAETKLIEAKGQADANAALTEALSDEILTNKFIEKWDGKLPVVSSSDGSILDISSLVQSNEEK